jgi:hypothetical protein
LHHASRAARVTGDPNPNPKIKKEAKNDLKKKGATKPHFLWKEPKKKMPQKTTKQKTEAKKRGPQTKENK